MGPDNQNQNIDGIKQSDTPSSTSGVDGFVTQPKQPTAHQFNSEQQNYDQQPNDQTAQLGNQPVAGKPKKQKSGKVTKIFLVLFIVLFAASATAAGIFYMQYQQSQEDLAAQQQKTAQLQKQVDELNSSTSKNQVEELTTENANLQKTINEQKLYIDSLTKVAQDLKTKCGASCNSIAIPPPPSTTTTTTTQ